MSAGSSLGETKQLDATGETWLDPGRGKIKIKLKRTFLGVYKGH